jgi:hypothetical protein
MTKASYSAEQFGLELNAERLNANHDCALICNARRLYWDVTKKKLQYE